MVTSSK